MTWRGASFDGAARFGCSVLRAGSRSELRECRDSQPRGAPERSRVYPSRGGHGAISLPEVTEGRRIAPWERECSEERGMRKKFLQRYAAEDGFSVECHRHEPRQPFSPRKLPRRGIGGRGADLIFRSARAPCNGEMVWRGVRAFPSPFRTGASRGLFHDGGRFDGVEIREILFEIGIPFHLDALLIRAAALGSAFTIFAVQLVHHVHAFNHLADSSKANIFLVRGREVSTPALHQGCVSGVMRRFLLEQLKSMNFRVRQEEVSTEDLLAADEVFLTNSIYDIRWVRQYREKEYVHEKTYALYQQLISPLYQ